jgi:hypothetical protein
MAGVLLILGLAGVLLILGGRALDLNDLIGGLIES